MMMKDKLKKNHHKGSYYIFRNFALSAVIVFSFVAAIAIPTYIGLQQVNNQTKADQQNEEEEKQNTDEEQSNLGSSGSFLKYSD